MCRLPARHVPDSNWEARAIWKKWASIRVGVSDGIRQIFSSTNDDSFEVSKRLGFAYLQILYCTCALVRPYRSNSSAISSSESA